MYWMVGCPPGGSAGTSFCRDTEMSINWRAMASSLFFLFTPIGASLDFGVKEAGAAARRALIVGRQEIDQDLSLRHIGGVRGDAGRIHGRQLAARRQRSGQGDARGGDDLGCLRAADRPFRAGYSQLLHRGHAVRKDLQPTSDLVSNA